MFSKTKRKIVLSIVLSLLTLLIATLASILISNKISLSRQNTEMLKEYTAAYSLENQAQKTEIGDEASSENVPVPPEGELKEPPDDSLPMKERPEFRLSTFYSVAFSDDGEVLSIDNGNNGMQSEDDLVSFAESMIKKGRKSGTEGSLSYLVTKKDGFTLVAAIDGTIGTENQRTLLRLTLMIGLTAVLVLLVISVFLARRIVRPLEKNDRTQRQFISNASHELKTPVAVIAANSELIRREGGGSEWLDNIEYENNKMKELITQLLALSKAENGEVLKETLDYSTLVSGEVLPFESLAFENGVSISSSIESGIIIKGNSSQLRQLISILLDNALSHGSGKLIELTLRREKHLAVLTVSNEAESMTEEQMNHIFDRFFRADESRNDSGSHYGLGLSIARAITENHCGNINVNYKNGKAVFTVSLPTAKQ